MVLANFVCFTVPSDVYIFIWYAILIRCRMTNKDRKITNQRRSQNILIPILGHIYVFVLGIIQHFYFPSFILTVSSDIQFVMSIIISSVIFITTGLMRSFFEI